MIRSPNQCCRKLYSIHWRWKLFGNKVFYPLLQHASQVLGVSIPFIRRNMKERQLLARTGVNEPVVIKRRKRAQTSVISITLSGDSWVLVGCRLSLPSLRRCHWSIRCHNASGFKCRISSAEVRKGSLEFFTRNGCKHKTGRSNVKDGCLYPINCHLIPLSWGLIRAQ